MDSAYVFWCSKCKVEHGGECQTKLDAARPVTIYISSGPQRVAPAISVGDRCHISFRNISKQTWTTSAQIYIVVAVNSDGSVVLQGATGGTTWTAGTGPDGISYADMYWDRIRATLVP